MGLHEQYQEVSRQRAILEQERQKNFEEVSRKRLAENIRQKFHTSFIGPLAQIEQHFGQLWGNKRNPDQMTEEERFWWQRYQAARNNILNNGNTQLRAIESELLLYAVRWNRHQMVLQPKKGQEAK